MTNEELAEIIMCPYNTAGDPDNIMPCVADDNVNPASDKDCYKCCLKWIQRRNEA